METRKANFFPARLICGQEELAERVQSNDRKQYFKTTDPKYIRSQVQNKSVFYSHHPNEITIDNTDKSPECVAKIIMNHLKQSERTREQSKKILNPVTY